jgi:hypothetical protein
MWEKEPSTVSGMLQTYQRAETAARHLELTPSFLTCKQAWPIGDTVGFAEAMLLLWDSVQPNHKDGSTRQFDTVRKLRSMSSNIQGASCNGDKEGIGFKDGGSVYALSQCSTNLVLFTKFIKGCEKRMGKMIKQDVALSVKILLIVLENLEQEFKSISASLRRKRDLVILGSFLVIGFCDALRGNEAFMVEGSNLCKYYAEGKQQSWEHVVIPMMGRFKGETGERNVLRFLVLDTQSGIKIGRWVERLVRVLIAEKRDDCSKPGPAFCDEEGQVLSYGYINDLFHEELMRVQESHSDLIPSSLIVSEVYNIYRSLRRGATSRATELNYSETIINLNNRWRTTQSNKGTGGIKKMSQLYVEMALVQDSLLQFSRSL